MRIFAVIIIIFCGISAAWGAKTLILDPDGIFAEKGLADTSEKFTALAGKTGKGFANAALMANLSGYPVGTSTLGAFPSFIAGVTLNVGLANLQRFDKDAKNNENVYPAGVLNPTIILGAGITEKTDILVKAMVFNEAVANIPYEHDSIALEALSIYSLGGRVRYSLVEPMSIMPGLFKFGGINFLPGVDILYWKMAGSGNINFKYDTIELAVLGERDIKLDTNYDIETSLFLVSLSSSVLAYLEAFWVFGIYTGAGLVLNYGSLDMEYISDSAVMVKGIDSPGDVVIMSSGKYTPYYISPIYILGMEFNLRFLVLSGETMVNLRNRSDINIQLGARFEY